jgi:hypothetical protein
LHNNDVQTTNVEDMTKKLLHDSRQRSCTWNFQALPSFVAKRFA